MKDVLYAIGEALIDFAPVQSGCRFDEVTAFMPMIGGAPANVCAAFANKYCGLIIRKKGAIPSYPHRSELEITSQYRD